MADQTVVDPLGRSITLHDHTWHGHIVLGHPEMSRRRSETLKCIEWPEKILYSNSEPECRIYVSLPYGSPSRHLQVIADIQLGIVLTAYQVKAPNRGGVEWQRQTP